MFFQLIIVKVKNDFNKCKLRNIKLKNNPASNIQHQASCKDVYMHTIA